IAGNGRDRIDIVLTDGHPGREPTNSLYHLTWSGGLFATTDGRPLGTVDDLPFDRRRITPCYDATRTGARAWIHDLALDADDQPVLVYARYPDPTDHRYHYARWDGTRWQDEALRAAGGWMPRPPDGDASREPHYSGGLSLDHADPNRVVLSREIDGRFEVEAWHRDAGGWHTRSLTAGSGQDRPPAVRGRRPDSRSAADRLLDGRDVPALHRLRHRLDDHDAGVITHGRAPSRCARSTRHPGPSTGSADGMADPHQPLQHGTCRATVDRGGAAVQRRAQLVEQRCGGERRGGHHRGGVEQHHVAHRSPPAAEQLDGDRGVVIGVAATQVRRARPRQAQSGRVPAPARDRSRAHQTARRPGHGR